MVKVIFAFLILTPAYLLAQFPFGTTEPTGAPEVHYYKFCEGIQMIEFDYLSSYHRRVNYLEQAQPRAMPWSSIIPLLPNVYVFRNEAGEIVKQYGYLYEIKLLGVQESLKEAKYHNSFSAQLGAARGFSGVSTRYFPYYLIGSKPNHTSGGSLGLIDSLGNEVLPQEFSEILQHDNIFITTKTGLCELRDKNLKVRFSSDAFYLQPMRFDAEFIYIMKEEQVGLIDTAGKIVVPCEYDMILEFNNLGFAQVVKNNKHGFVNRKGELVIQCKYQNFGEFSEGLVNARLNDEWGYLNTKGKTVIPHQYDIGMNFKEGVARVAKRESMNIWRFGFIDKNGKEVIPLIYSDARDFEKGIAEVFVEGEWIKIDTKGNKLNR